ncbi:S-layer homology domain-containing protein, partial [Brevibacillus halotolerans]|uniref:S-layer homology domain-containing protein n=1 Tax=Brevibacillus halotolerans TaxID=1507437 RepID=UPI0015EF6BB7
GGGSTTAPSTPGTGGGSTTAPSTPGTGGGSTTAPSTPGTGGESTDTKPEPDEDKDVHAKKIEPSVGDLDPKFKPNRYKYEIVVPFDEKGIKFKVRTNVKKSAIKVDGEKIKEGEYSDKIRLDEGKNIIKITIEDKYGNDVRYTITVIREKDKSTKYKSSKYNSSNQVAGYRNSIVTLPSKPSVTNLRNNQLIGRQGHIAFEETLEMKSGSKVQLTLTDSSKIKKVKDEGKELRGYYWNANFGKWVALATEVTYSESQAVATITTTTTAPNWYALFAVNQPSYTDITGHWAKNAIDRLTGLGTFDGYDTNKGYSSYIFKPNNEISRLELATILSRILGVSNKSEGYTLYNVLQRLSSQEEKLVKSRLQGVPTWAISYVSPLTKANVVPQHFGNNFNGNVTRAEAAVFITNALRSIPSYQFQVLNVRVFNDGNTMPSWAIDKIDARVMRGDTTGNLHPNKILTRAELAEMLDRTLKTLGW